MGLYCISVCYGRFTCDFQVIRFTLDETNSQAGRGPAKILSKHIYRFLMHIFVIITKQMKAFTLYD